MLSGINSKEDWCPVASLAQHPPFRMVDRIVTMNECTVTTALEAITSTPRFVHTSRINTYVMLEMAAQTSGLLISHAKKKGRGVISSFEDIKRHVYKDVQYPIQLCSKIVGERPPFYTFEFQVKSNETLVLTGIVTIFVGEQNGTR